MICELYQPTFGKTQKMQGYFYIITNISYIKDSLYKIGKTISGEDDLRKRYKTYFINPVIIYHRKVKGNYSKHETNLKSILKPYRVPHGNDDTDGLSEFVHMDLESLVQEVEKYFSYADEASEELETYQVDTEDSEESTPVEEQEEPTVTISLKDRIIKDESYVLNPDEPHRECTACHIIKNFDEFGAVQNGKHGRRAMCNNCRNQMEKARRELNKIYANRPVKITKK
jgi:hypothetical protein